MGKAKSQKPGSKRRASPNRASRGRATRTAVMRRPPEKGLPRLQHNMRGMWRDSLELSPLWIVLFVLVSTWCLLPRQVFFVPTVEAGSIAGRTYIADKDLSVPNEAQTEALQRRARDEALPVYDFDRGLEVEVRRQLAELFAAGRAAFGEREPADQAGEPTAEEGEELAAEILARLAEASAFKVTTDQLELLHRREFATVVGEHLGDRIGAAI